MNTLYLSVLRVALVTLFCAALQPVVAAAAEPAPVKREIIPGSELMTAQEREHYRQRQRGARSEEDRERLRAEHVKTVEERARVRGLEIVDYSRMKKGRP
jgi:hypothetical protein